jgi:hypothetical protein
LIVIDVGCHTWGEEESVHKLVKRFRPNLLLGFDPHPDLEEGYCYIGETLVLRRRACGWIAPGQLPIAIDGLITRVDTTLPHMVDHEWVDCIDIASLILSLPKPIVLKLDAEQSEEDILSWVRKRGADRRLELVLVELHCRTCHMGGGTHTAECVIPDMTTIGDLACPSEPW